MSDVWLCQGNARVWQSAENVTVRYGSTWSHYGEKLRLCTFYSSQVHPVIFSQPWLNVSTVTRGTVSDGNVFSCQKAVWYIILNTIVLNHKTTHQTWNLFHVPGMLCSVQWVPSSSCLPHYLNHHHNLVENNVRSCSRVRILNENWFTGFWKRQIGLIIKWV